MSTEDRIKALDDVIKNIDEIEQNQEREKQLKNKPLIDPSSAAVSASYAMSGVYYTATTANNNPHVHTVQVTQHDTTTNTTTKIVDWFKHLKNGTDGS